VLARNIAAEDAQNIDSIQPILDRRRQKVMSRKSCATLKCLVFQLLLLAFTFGACSKALKDDSISQSLRASFFSDPQLKNELIEVAVANGEVTLSGEVSTDTARLRAFKLANDTAGVKKVIDAMHLKPQTDSVPAGQQPPEALAEKTAPAIEKEPKRETPPPTSPPKVITVPAGTEVRVQMIDSISSKTGKVGSSYLASLYAPITVGDRVVVPKGADVYVRLANAKQAGRIKGSSELELELDHLVLHAHSIPLKSSTYKEAGGSRGKQTAKRTALGTGVGAAIGAIAGGGKGAAIGAGVGAGGALATQALTHGKSVEVPSETKLDFKLAEPFGVVPASKAK